MLHVTRGCYAIHAEVLPDVVALPSPCVNLQAPLDLSVIEVVILQTDEWPRMKP
jgi:hypothetical protein